MSEIIDKHKSKKSLELETKNACFQSLLDEIEKDVVQHQHIVSKIQLKAVDYDGYDFTKDVDYLLKEQIDGK